MSLPPQKSKNDYNKYLNTYLATLNQSIQNNNLVYNAVSANLMGDMSAVPQMPEDTRSVEEKMRDIENLKVQLQSQLMSLTDGKTANEIVQSLNDLEIQQAVQSFPSLYATLKPLWSMGVPSVIFVQALRNLSQKQDLTAGIEMNLQQGNSDTLQLSPQQLRGLIDGSDLDNLRSVSQGLPPQERQGLLSQISYVKQLLFDKGDLPNRIERARQLEAESGIDQSIPVSVQEFLIPKDDFNVELNELNQAIANGNASDRDRTLKNIMDALTPPEEVVADMQDFDSAPSQQGEKRERVSRKLESRLSSQMGEEEKVSESSSKPKKRGNPMKIQEEQRQVFKKSGIADELSARQGAKTRAKAKESKEGVVNELGERRERQAVSTIESNVRPFLRKRREQRAGEQIATKLGAVQRGIKGRARASEIKSMTGEDQRRSRASEQSQQFSLKAPAEEQQSSQPSPARTVVGQYSGESPSSSSVATQPYYGPAMSPGTQETWRNALMQLISDEGSISEIKARQRKVLTDIERQSGRPFIHESTGDEISIDDIIEGKMPHGNKVKASSRRQSPYWLNIINTKQNFDIAVANIKKAQAQAQAKAQEKPKKIGGSGVRRMSGRGVSFTIKEEPETKPKSIKLKIAGVIEKEPSYVPFGRYAINKHKLANDIFMLRTQKGGAIPRLLTQKLSGKLSKIIKTIADKGTPSFESIGELETLDKEILHKILSESHISSISTPNPSRDQDEQDHRRFLILKGELIAGNSNPSVAKELKRLILKLMTREILPRREAQNALVELAMLETI